MRTILVILFLLQAVSSNGQNLDKIGKKDAIKIGGGLNFNSIVYANDQISFPSREPFTWFASGNLNINILDVALPFTFSYSNQGGKFTQPFNRTAVHPSYKWVKTHIGMISTTFSPYTLSGHLFLGGAAELSPGKWKIQLMAGRLVKAVEYNSVDDNLNNFSFGRFGYGLRIGYTHSKIQSSLTIFKAKDNPLSVNIIPFNSQISPQDNLVLSVDTKINLIKNLSVSADYALSGLTQNSLEIGSDSELAKMSFLNPLISGNSTTAYYNAFKGSVDYKLKWSSYSLKFEHIDPGYKTLGGYYFNNDLQNYTFAPMFNFFKNRLNIGVNTGFQLNNLGGQKTATTKRWVGNVNVTAIPLKGLVVNATYSNFSTYTRNRPIGDPFYYAPADTMNFYQLTQNASAIIAYSKSSDNHVHAVQCLYNYQESLNLSGALTNVGAFGSNLNPEEAGIPARIHNSNLSYTIQFKKSLFAISVIGNYNVSLVENLRSEFIGPSINLQKSLAEKRLNIALGSTYNLQYQNAVKTGDVLNYRLSITYKPKAGGSKWKNYNLSLNSNLLQRLSLDPNTLNATELFVYLNFGYSF